MLLSLHLSSEMPAESPWQAATATAAYSCNRTVAALHQRLVGGWQWCGGGGFSTGLDSKFFYLYSFITC
jgi:hypothetical protein